MREQFHDEFAMLKGVAVGAVANLARNFLQNAFPELLAKLQPSERKTSSAEAEEGERYFNGPSSSAPER
ncbi:MAG: hypothetical protein AB7G75_07975 [Candidatus Binatia bacterium]